MIEDLTIQKLIDYGFSPESITRLTKWKDYPDSFLTNDKGCFYASNIEKKIYTGIDALRKKYFKSENQIAFPENCYPLMLEYYDIQFKKYLEKYKKIKVANGSVVNETQAEQYYLDNEIEIVNKKIKEIESEIVKFNTIGISNTNHLHNNVTEIQQYLLWLNSKKGTLNPNSTSPIENITENLNLHPTIFINGFAYQLFMKWHDKFNEDVKNQGANYSFIIRKMIKDKFILDIKHSVYFEFLSGLGINLSRLKTLSNCTTRPKNALYLELKKSISVQNN